MDTFTKKDFLISKYSEMKTAIMGEEFAHKFQDLLPSLETTSISDIILFIHLSFVGKGIISVIKQLLKNKSIDLEDKHITTIADYIHQFLQFLELINML
jgi:hypothetical protein